MNLRAAEPFREYTVQRVEIDDEEMVSFLFSLGCYSGEPITVIRHMRGGSIIAIKDARYSIDRRLAEAIKIA